MKKLEQLFPIICAPEATVIAIRKVRASLVLVLILIPFVSLSQPALAFMLEVQRENGETIFSRHLDEGDRWCVHWNHSVQGFLVRDCYRVSDGRMMLERSHQPDFAAGLGHIPGRGEMTSAPEGGYWIENMDEYVQNNCYRLRVGARGVDHTLVLDGYQQNLSETAARERVSVMLRADDHSGRSGC
jgi:hypothetical protein